MTLQQQKDLMIKYLLMKAEIHDWHGVRDAAAEIEVLESLIKQQNKI